MGWGEPRVAKREVEVRPGQVVVVLDLDHARSLEDLLVKEEGRNPWKAWARRTLAALRDAR